MPYAHRDTKIAMRLQLKVDLKLEGPKQTIIGLGWPGTDKNIICEKCHAAHGDYCPGDLFAICKMENEARIKGVE